MSAWNEDPLFDRIRALPKTDVRTHTTKRVLQMALAKLDAEAVPRMGAGQFIAGVAVAAGVLAYFGWAIAFVLVPRL